MDGVGSTISTTRLGMPDAGLITYREMVEQGRLITLAVSIPIIGDADIGYGNAMNVKRTVKEYIRAGFAGIMLEDQIYFIHIYFFFFILLSLCLCLFVCGEIL